MKLLMHLRDPLPPTRVDVSVLFGQCLAERGVHTTYLGHPGAPETAAPPAADCIDLGPRLSPLVGLRACWHLLRSRRSVNLLLVRDRPVLGGLLFVLAAVLRLPRAYWRSFPIALGDRIAAGIHQSQGRRLRAAAVWLRGHACDAIERWLTLPLAQHVFVQSQAMQARLLAQSPRLAARMSAVPMGVDTTSLKHLPAPPLVLEPGRWIGYLGSLDRARQLDALVHALACVRRQGHDAKLLLMGASPRADDLHWLLNEAERLGLREQVRHVPALPLREAWAVMQQVDVAVSPIPSGPLYDVSSPTKVVEYLALGLPVVASDIPDQRELLAQCGGGLCVAFDAQAMGQAVAHLLNHLPESREQARLAGPKVLALRAYPVLAEQVEQQLRSLVERQPGHKPGHKPGRSSMPTHTAAPR
jgi:glycosyltransferase involved in cell wall biosynthesis